MEGSAELFALIASELRAKHDLMRGVSREELAETVAFGADRETTSRMDQLFEELIISIITDQRVKAHLISEEVGGIEINGGDPKVTIILDPLDGTTNALSGFPFYASSIAIMEGDEVVAGMIYHLSTGDRFTAFQGRGATRNDSPIRVNEEEKLSQAQIVLSRALCSEEVPLYHYWSENARRMRHTGCPTLDCCYVAAGTFSAYVDLHLPQGKLCVHDIAAASLIVEEAGGQLLDQDGKPLKILPSLEDRFNVFAVNNKKIFEELRRPIRYDLPHTPARET